MLLEHAGCIVEAATGCELVFRRLGLRFGYRECRKRLGFTGHGFPKGFQMACPGSRRFKWMVEDVTGRQEKNPHFCGFLGLPRTSLDVDVVRRWDSHIKQPKHISSRSRICYSQYYSQRSMAIGLLSRRGLKETAQENLFADAAIR